MNIVDADGVSRTLHIAVCGGDAAAQELAALLDKYAAWAEVQS